MFTITEAAGQYLTMTLERANAPQDHAIRFVLNGDELSPKLDTPRPGDQTFDYAGRKVLLLDPGACEYLGDATLDVRATEEGQRLLIVH
jgi:hypothetical protein